MTAGEVDEEVDALYNLEEQLEQQRERDWTDYSRALTASITTAASGLHGIRVPVVVEMAAAPPADLGQRPFCAAAWQLLQAAIEATPVPGDKRQPMERLLSGIPGHVAHRPPAGQRVLSQPPLLQDMTTTSNRAGVIQPAPRPGLS